MVQATGKEEPGGGTGEEHRSIFEKDGFLCFTKAIPQDHLNEWQTFASTYFDQCFRQLYENGNTQFPSHRMQTDKGETRYALGVGVKHGFREIVMRSPGRYEMSLLECSQSPSIDLIKERLYPLVPNILGANNWDDISLCHLSLLVSTAGAPEQSWHADGGHASLTEHLPCHVANIFIPLVDVPLQLGPTEFRPGSHVYTRNLAPLMLAAHARKQLRATQTPELQVGDVLVFDWRVLHRGKANQLKCNRPILVLTYSTWDGYKDVCNFPKRSMFEGAVAGSDQA